MITLDTFDGHLVLYCKNHYNVKEIGFLTGLRRIWAIKCGYSYDDKNTSVDRYIADHLYNIVKITDFHPNLQQLLHDYITNRINYHEENESSIEQVIMFYRLRLSMLQIKEKKDNQKRYRTIIKLPKSKKRIFKLIIKGKGKFYDYKLIT